MARPRTGDTVKVHYTGRLNDGQIFDSSRDGDPLQLTVGEHQVIPGLERVITEMDTGERKTVTIPADEAYGPIRQELVVTVNRSDVPSEVPLIVGEELQVQAPAGPHAFVRVAGVSEQEVVLDANHPLAGEDLTLELELLEIVERS